ncbi:MAG TPA: universal stress protein [Acidobacteriaceae bacterium]|jgi:nucleotide-binding universal stress UspA family protein|nr:universal stress protein [Acidobacteriaceae bacterium]
MKVLLGIDNSKYADDIAEALIAQFRPQNTEVLVLHVLQPLGLMAPPEMAIGYAPELADQKQPAHQLVERIADQFRSAEFKAQTAVEAGDVRECILDTAAEWHANLIVVGSHGTSGIQRFLLGSVAEFVAHHAKCSVQIFRTPAHP